jgi:hypothetical protein
MTGPGVPPDFSIVITLRRMGTNVFLNTISNTFTATGSGDYMSNSAIIPSNYRPSYYAIGNSSARIGNFIPIMIAVSEYGHITIQIDPSTWEDTQTVILFDYHLGWARTADWV